MTIALYALAGLGAFVSILTIFSWIGVLLDDRKLEKARRKELEVNSTRVPHLQDQIDLIDNRIDGLETLLRTKK